MSTLAQDRSIWTWLFFQTRRSSLAGNEISKLESGLDSTSKSFKLRRHCRLSDLPSRIKKFSETWNQNLSKNSQKWTVFSQNKDIWPQKGIFQTLVFWWGKDGRDEFAGPWLHVTLATLFFFAHPVYKSLKECKYLKRGKEEPNSAKELVNHFSYSSNCSKKTRMNKYQNIENTVNYYEN